MTEARAPSIEEVLASSRVLDDPRALWPEKRPRIARQVCVDWIDSSDDFLSAVMDCPCRECPDSQSCLAAKRLEVGALMFDREYLTTPRAATSSLFPMERMQRLLVSDLELVPGFKPTNPSRYWIVNSWDLAWSERTGGDFLAKISQYHDRKTGKRRILDVARWRGLTFRNQVELIRQQHLLYSTDMTVIEEAGAQTVWVQEVKTQKQTERFESLASELADIKVLGHSASDKRSFQAGVPAMLLDIERGVWEFPFKEGSYHHEEMLNFLTELEAFGWNDDKLEGVGEHDDTVMAWYHGWWGLEYGMRQRATVTSSRELAQMKLPSRRG